VNKKQQGGHFKI